MKIISNPSELQGIALDTRFSGQSTALVPTMGFLHDGHKSLLLAARNKADKVILSIFVNPAQFGPNEDLAAYPRDFTRDCEIAENAGVDIVFAPKPEAMYSPAHATWVEVPELAKNLCGKSRPIHFRGVCTIVLKLFNLTLPNFALFGEKDWQQLAIIRAMTADLNLPIKIEGCPIVREADGLALSSRNAYLTQAEREQAPHIYKGLKLAQKLAREGESDPKQLKGTVVEYWKNHLPDGVVDYLEFVDPVQIASAKAVHGETLLAAAVKLGKARLIDNLLIRS